MKNAKPEPKIPRRIRPRIKSRLMLQPALWFSLTVSLAQAAEGPLFRLSAAQAALPNSLEWQQAELNLQAAQNALEQAQAAAGLKLNAGGDYSLGQSGTTNGLRVSSSASVSLLPWSSAFDDIRAKERALGRARLSERDAKNTLYIKVLNAYFTARLAILDQRISERNIALQEALVRIANSQRSLGQATAETLATANYNLETARTKALQTGFAFEAARTELANILGIDRASIGTLEDTAEAPSSSLGSSNTALETLLEEALAQRSDVLQARSQLKDAEDALANAQRDRFIPSASVNVGYNDSGVGLSAGLNMQTGVASLSGSYSLLSASSTSSSGDTTDRGGTFSLSASISLPIIAPSQDARVRVAHTSFELASRTLAQVEQTARLDVSGRLNDTRLSREQLRLAHLALDQAKLTAQTAQAKLTAGIAVRTDLEQAEIAVLQAERNLEGAITEIVLNEARLNQALGREIGREVDNSTPTNPAPAP